MARETLLTEMSKAVAQLIQKGYNYRKAFAEVAHQNNIWHNRNKEQYNYHFKQVMSRVRKIIGRENLSQACKKKVEPKKNLVQQIHLPL